MTPAPHHPYPPSQLPPTVPDALRTSIPGLLPITSQLPWVSPVVPFQAIAPLQLPPATHPISTALLPAAL